MLVGGVPRRMFKECESINEPLDLWKPTFASAPHSLIGIAVGSDYRHFRCRFLSKELRCKCFDHLTEFGHDALAFVRKNTRVFEQAGMLFSDLFEVFAMRQICLGKEADLVPLNAEARSFCSEGTPWHLVMPSAEQRKISNENDVILDTERPIMWVPNSGFPAVDFFYTLPKKASDGGTLVLGLQMTMNSKHALNGEKLKKLIDTFGKNFVLVCVLTGKPFEEFSERKPTFKRDNTTNEESQVSKSST